MSEYGYKKQKTPCEMADEIQRLKNEKEILRRANEFVSEKKKGLEKQIAEIHALAERLSIQSNPNTKRKLVMGIIELSRSK